jgi:hypothetical protein
MTKLLRATSLLLFLLLASGHTVRGEDALTCHVDGGTCPSFELSCDWDEPSDCWNEEPVWNLCDDTCWSRCPTGFQTDYVASSGSACFAFDCECHYVGL